MPVNKQDKLSVLCEHDLSEVLHPYAYLQGLVFAVAASPEIPMPDTWLPWVFQQSGRLTSSAQADQLADLLMAALQTQLGLMREERIGLPQGYQFPADRSIDAPVCQWCRGLVAGHAQLEKVWQQAWQRGLDQAPTSMPKMQKNLRHCLNMFTTFADPSLAVERAQQRGNSDLANRLPEIFNALPKSLKTYVDLSGQLVRFLPDQFELLNTRSGQPQI